MSGERPTDVNADADAGTDTADAGAPDTAAVRAGAGAAGAPDAAAVRAGAGAAGAPDAAAVRAGAGAAGAPDAAAVADAADAGAPDAAAVRADAGAAGASDAAAVRAGAADAAARSVSRGTAATDEATGDIAERLKAGSAVRGTRAADEGHGEIADRATAAGAIRGTAATDDGADGAGGAGGGDDVDEREHRSRGQESGGPQAREKALACLAELIAEGGAAPFLLPPVIPGDEAFPDPWAQSAAAVKLLVRRLAWYAAIDCEVVIDDRRAGAPPTERKPSTKAELVAARGKEATFALGFIGTDDVVGTLALEVGTLYALTHRTDLKEPYRTPEVPPNADRDVIPLRTVDAARDHARGAVAAVYRGLGVLAANAAYQQYVSPGRFNGMYVPHEYDVIKAGALPMSTMTYLVAVQAVVRGETEPPKGLSQSQHHEVLGYLKTLAKESTALCERLGIDPETASAAREREREKPVPFADAGDVQEDVPRKNAWRWQTNRGGIGFVAGTVLGMGFAFVISRGMMPFTTFGGATVGHLVGRRVRTPRCSACATIVRIDAPTCWKCGAALRGDIASLAERLEAEERLELEQTSKSSASS